MSYTEEQYLKCRDESFKAGREVGADERQTFIHAKITDRVNDLRCCTKTDNCRELADLIESYIPEWLREEK